MATEEMAGYGSVDWHEEANHVHAASTPLAAQAASSRQWRARGIMLAAMGAVGVVALTSRGSAAPGASGTLLKETPTLGGRPFMSSDTGSSASTTETASPYDPEPSEVSSHALPHCRTPPRSHRIAPHLAEGLAASPRSSRASPPARNSRLIILGLVPRPLSLVPRLLSLASPAEFKLVVHVVHVVHAGGADGHD